jgi:chromosome partitioning protein
MAKIALYGSQKGGVGKSTLTALTAAALSSPPFSRRVYVADLDPQQSLIRRRLSDLRDFNGIPPYKLDALTLAELLGEIERLDRDFDLVLLDVHGKLDAHLAPAEQEIAKLLLIADVLLVPITPGNFSLDSTLGYLQTAFRVKARRADRPLEIFALVNMHEPGTIDGKLLSEEIEEIRAMIPALKVVKTPLNRYASFRAIDTLASLYDPASSDKARANFRAWIEELAQILK